MKMTNFSTMTVFKESGVTTANGKTVPTAQVGPVHFEKNVKGGLAGLFIGRAVTLQTLRDVVALVNLAKRMMGKESGAGAVADASNSGINGARKAASSGQGTNGTAQVQKRGDVV